jgi:hypothetical protein
MQSPNVAPFSPRRSTALEGGNGGPHPPDMSDLSGRVAKIEGSVDGLKSSVDALRWVIGILAVIVVGSISFLGFQITRIDSRVAGVESKIDQLPERINNNMLNLTKTLSDAITAAKQQTPQVILLQPPPPMSPQK